MARTRHPFGKSHNKNPILQNDELDPLMRLWILRILVPLGGSRFFIEKYDFSDDDLALALNLEKFKDPEDKMQIREINRELQSQYQQAEDEAQQYQLPSMLQENINQVAKMLALDTAECRILAFSVMLKLDDRLEVACDLFRGAAVKKRYHKILAVVLDVSEREIRDALHGQSILKRSGILSNTRYSGLSISDRLDLLSDDFAEALFAYDRPQPVELLRDIILPSEAPKLTLKDYGHIESAVNVMMAYLQQSLAQKKQGVNILLYGPPGTGKTQLCRLMAELCSSQLYEVSSEDSDGDVIPGTRRLSAFRAAQYFLVNTTNLLLFDEVEDVFEDSTDFLGRRRGNNKAWMNRMLEGNSVPTFWVSNSIESMDSANIRRFDMVVEIKVPGKKQREAIIEQSSNGLLPAEIVKCFAESEVLAPAVVERAANVVHSIRNTLEPEQQSDAMAMLLNATLKGQGYKPVNTRAAGKLPEVYNPAFINADADMAAIAEGLTRHHSGRLCLFGPPGTGKTAYGHWLAEKLQKPLLMRRASDLLDKYVGGTERNIAEAFARAEQDKAILMIDEIDSFLQDRRNARQSWEVSHVNEMLTQMESFPGIFIASTNLMEGMDQASLRRFDLKARFGYLLAEQAWQLFCCHCKALQLNAENSTARLTLHDIPNLTPGDFAAVIRQSRFNPLNSAEDFATALAREVALKEKPQGQGMGFIRH